MTAAGLAPVANRGLIKRLHALRRRERAIAFAWGAARVVAIVVVIVAVACSVDWWIDRRRETPLMLRAAMLVGQIAIALAAAGGLLGPVFRRRSDDELALFVEESRPALGHRLISAVQFPRHPAKVALMSGELIGVTTREAISAASTIDFPALADHRRLKKAGWLALGIVATSLLMLALMPRTLPVLLARQLLADREIPRDIHIENRTAAIQPAAEPVTLRLAVTGPGPFAGEVRLYADGGPAERHAITTDPIDGELSLSVPAPAGDFAFEAWVGDGRLHGPAHVKLVPRPAVTSLSASLILPTYCGVKPDGSPYEQPLPRGEVAGIVGCSARVFAKTQKPMVRAELELLGLADGDKQPPVSRTLKPYENGPDSLAFRFDLRDDETAYRVRVWDENGFGNLDPPRRDVRLVPEEPPVVTLLPEQFRPEGLSGSSEDFEADGVPVPLGGAVRIGYTIQHPYGLGKAALVYRINEGDWHRLGLREVTPSAQSGPFDAKRGCFQKSLPGEQVQFTAVPSADPAVHPGRLEGGGRFDFQTRSLPGIKVGDQIEFFVEVSSRHPDRPLAGRSETRMKRVVTVTELVEWIDATLRQEDRIRRLADRQRGVFESK